MLTYLRIKDFALIRELALELGPGLTVLTGETGAGKSIILAAVSLLLGQRASADLIRAGADSALVEAQFVLDPDGPVARRLAQEGLEAGEELVVRRVVSRQGRNRVQVGGSLATLALLAELGPMLLALCGQHAQQDLLRSEEHLLLLDAFAGADALRGQVAQAHAQVRELDQRLAELRRRQEERARRREELAATVEELETAGLDPEEEASLKAERRRLANAEQVAALAQGASAGLVEAEEGAAVEVLAKVRSLLDDLARLDDEAAPLAQRADELFYQAEDLGREVGGYASRLVFDPGRLDWVEARLHQLQRLVRKYGGDVASALEALEEARAGLAGLDKGQGELKELDRQRRAALDQALALARELSRRRREAAGLMARAAEKELGELGLSSCRLKVELEPPTGAAAVDTPAGPLGPRGLEQAEIFIAPNPGEGFRQLRRIASGGELSRILLALKGLVAQRRGAPTQVFDEVDAGIGGGTGHAVGRKLAALARQAQVLVITHLPQIAAFGQAHFTVRKETREGRTATLVEELGQKDRAEELARMLAGGGPRDTAREHALRLLEEAGALHAREGRPQG